MCWLCALCELTPTPYGHGLAQVEELIQATLEKLAQTGFSSTAIEAALNTTEFHLRENNTGRFPRGLSLMLRAMGNWIYDKDPYEALQWTQALDNFKARGCSARPFVGYVMYLGSSRHMHGACRCTKLCRLVLIERKYCPPHAGTAVIWG